MWVYHIAKNGGRMNECCIRYVRKTEGRRKEGWQEKKEKEEYANIKHIGGWWLWRRERREKNEKYKTLVGVEGMDGLGLEWKEKNYKWDEFELKQDEIVRGREWGWGGTDYVNENETEIPHIIAREI